MEQLLNLPNVTKNDLIQAQWCQLYLGMTTLADICSSNGLYICEWALMGQEWPRSSKFIFPTQSCPSKLVWNTWSRLLCLCLCRGSAMKLSEPLGRWYKGQRTQTWNTVLEPKSMQIFIWDQGCVYIYKHQGQSKKWHWYVWPHNHNSFPIGCIPVTGKFQAGQFIIDGS